jgi:hypothetical protein
LDFFDNLVGKSVGESAEDVLPQRYTQILDKCKSLSPEVRPVVLIFDEWHVKFEGASTKCNRKPVHANIISFLGPQGTETNPLFTYTVCIGNDSDNSHAVEVQLFQELDCLCSKV